MVNCINEYSIMKTVRVKYLRHVIRARRWANTERGERTLCTIGAIWGILALISLCLLAVGCVLNYYNVTL